MLLRTSRSHPSCGHHALMSEGSAFPARPSVGATTVTETSVELRALAQRVADALPVEIIEEVILTGSVSRGTADQLSDIANGTAGLLARWQARLAVYPDDLVLKRVERAASSWGGYTPAGMLTVARPGERLAMIERMVDDANRVMSIVYAINRVWQPTNKRLASRSAVAATAVGAKRLLRRGRPVRDARATARAGPRAPRGAAPRGPCRLPRARPRRTRPGHGPRGRGRASRASRPRRSRGA
jgi:hypothetical protein